MLTRQNVEIALPMWLFPWLTYAVILFISGALVVMMFTPEHRAEITSTISLALVISLIGIFVAGRHGHAQRPAALPESD